MHVYGRLLTYAKPYIAFILGSFACMLILSATTSGIAYLVKPAIDDVFVKNSPRITGDDISDWNAALCAFQATGAGVHSQILASSMSADDLRALRGAGTADEMTDAMRLSIVRALNGLIDNTRFFPDHCTTIHIADETPAKEYSERLLARRILVRQHGTDYVLKKSLSRSDAEEIRWFNISLLSYLYPGFFNKAPRKNYTLLYLIPLLLICTYLLKGLADFGQSYLMGYVGNHVVADLMEASYRHILGLSMSFFTSTSTGVLMSRIANDVAILQRSVSDALKKIIENSFLVIGLTGVAFYQNWKMATVCFLLLPFVIFPISRFGKRSKKYSRRGQKKMGRISTFLDESITGNQTVKAYCMEAYENKRFAEETDRLLRINMKDVKITSLASPVMEFYGGILGATLIYYGGYNVINEVMTPGQFFSFIAALAMLYRPVKGLNRENMRIQKGMAAAVRVFEILDLQPAIQDRPGALALPGLQKGIEFRDVSFQYDDKPVLKNVSFSVQAGKSIAFVGHSGAGKTTIANLLMRFYDVTGGAILIDGVDIRDATVKSLRSQIAFVSQETILFNDSIHANITYGNSTVSEAAVFQAAQAAYAHEFIQSLPQGYNTVVGEKGIRLSGGQQQRLAIARALLKNAPILILDEATSALDARSEQIVQKALDNLMRGRTTLLIAHRLSTIRNADQIVVLEDGAVIEHGTHDDLIRKRGIYHRLIDIQKGFQQLSLKST